MLPLIYHSAICTTFNPKNSGINFFSGALINSVQKGGAGESAGLRKNDIIINFNQRQIISAPQLRELLAQLAPGDLIKTIILRGSDEMVFSVVLSASSTGKSGDMTGNRRLKTKVYNLRMNR
jgi:S1-C subfamily serine protease